MQASHSCPVCDGRALTLLHAFWQNRNSPTAFRLHPDRYFAACERCGTIFRYPLIVFEDTNEYGREYYEVPDAEAGRYIEEHVAKHQKFNYDNIVALLREKFPPPKHRRWLDVGSVGYPTTFADYEFHTVEPSRTAVAKGKQLFAAERIYQGTIETHQPPSPYDGLLFNNSFYCLPAPRASLARCRELLSEGGIVVVTLATYLNGAIQDSGDGNIDRIEDFICGDTLHVYYNEHSLRYLFASAGFEFLGAHTLAAYGHKTMIAYAFRKAATTSAPDAGLLDKARSYMRERLDSAFAGFERETAASLESIDRPDVVLYGETALIRELNGMRPLRNLRGIVPSDIAVPAGTQLDGMKVIDLDELKRQLAAGSGARVVVASFTAARPLAAQLLAQLGHPDCGIYIPTRASWLRSIRFDFGGASRLSKAFRLIRMENPAPVAPATVAERGSLLRRVGRRIKRLLGLT